MRCSICDSGKVEEVERTGRILFQCSNGHQRPTVVTDRDYLQATSFQNRDVPIKVASVVFTGEEIVMVKRKKFPFLYSLPFKHLMKNEEPEKAVRKAVKQQTGLEITEFEQFKDTVIANRCWRGCDLHNWIFFKAEVERQMLRTCEIADEVRWFDRKEIIQGLPIGDGTRYLYNEGLLNRLTVL